MIFAIVVILITMLTMATVSLNIAAAATVTITLSSLANATFATSSAIDNSTNKYLSALVQLKWKTGAAGTSSTGYVAVYLIRSADAGTTYDDNNKVLLGTMPVAANATTYVGSWDTAPLGALGSSWKLAVENQGGGTSDTVAGSFTMKFGGVKYDVA